MQAGMAAAAATRANGGAAAHIDAIAAPNTCEIAGITLACYPLATYCAMQAIHPWCQRLLKAANEEVPQKEEADEKEEDKEFKVPVEVMLAQVYAFAVPTQAYFRARNGEGDYLAAAFKWSEQNLTGADRWERLGLCYRFVLEQCGLLKAVNPQTPETMNPPGTAPATTNQAPETSVSAPAATQASCPQ